MRLFESKNTYIRNSESKIIKNINKKNLIIWKMKKCLICFENNCNIKILCNHKYYAQNVYQDG